MGWFKKKEKIELTNDETITLSVVNKHFGVKKDEIEIVSEDIKQLYKEYDIKDGWVAVPEIPDNFIGESESIFNDQTGQLFFKIRYSNTTNSCINKNSCNTNSCINTYTSINRDQKLNQLLNGK